MKKLSKLSTTIVLAVALRKKFKDSEFPRFFRFITERPFTSANLYLTKMFIFSFLCGFLLLSIVLESIALVNNLKEAKLARLERNTVAKEISYWKGIANKYKGYRDAYVALASLEYRLGDVQTAKQYMKIAYALDPNFDGGRVLGAKVGF